MKPAISVVIPTHNRAARLPETLGGLAVQTADPRSYEVILVADGCSDGTAGLRRSLVLPYRLTVIEQPAMGRASARNAGASLAAADIVLFLDDDMTAGPGLIEAHLAAHAAGSQSVVIGHFPLPRPIGDANIFEGAVRGWWDAFFTQLAEEDHRFTYRDFCTGNVSLPRALFTACGGFDVSIEKGAAGEDWELGLRLIRKRVRFRYAPAATAIHNDRPSLESALRRSREEGFGHCRIAGRHPELFMDFNLSRLSRLQDSQPLRPVWRLLWFAPAIAAPPIFLLRVIHRTCQGLKLYNTMWRAHGLLTGHAYWLGARAALGSLAAWEALRARSRVVTSQPREATVDLTETPGRIGELLEAVQPDALHITYKNQPVCRIPPSLGAEPLRWPHVRSELLRRHHWVLQWILLEEAVGGAEHSKEAGFL